MNGVPEIAAFYPIIFILIQNHLILLLRRSLVFYSSMKNICLYLSSSKKSDVDEGEKKLSKKKYKKDANKVRVYKGGKLCEG